MAKILISLPDALLKELDDYCDKNKYNRSEFLRFAIRKLIQVPPVANVDNLASK